MTRPAEPMDRRVARGVWWIGVASLALGLPWVAADPAWDSDPCRLLADADLRAVQNDRVTETKRSETRSGPLRVAQCFYRTADVVRSVSVVVTAPVEPAGSGARDYWRARFHAPPAGEGGPKPDARPKAVPGLGEEAFWVGDRLTGALYVLAGRAFLRISVGGIAEEATRLQKTKALGERALRGFAPR